jgi:molybdopterin-containing oxidoreductase family iron-sulfur binding subunit
VSDSGADGSGALGAPGAEPVSGARPSDQGPELRAGRRYFRSLEEFAQTAEFRRFIHEEFPKGAQDLLDSGERRQFLKIMGASMALAGLGLSGAGCRRWPDEKIVPYAHRPANRTPGAPEHFATAMEIGGIASGLLVTSYDGRPIKIEGNPDHPMTAGATDAVMQASILGLYDPDRSKRVLNKGVAASWEAFAAWLKERLVDARAGGGRKLAILTEATASPTVGALRERIRSAMPEVRWFTWEPINDDLERAGSVAAFGGPLRAHYAFDKAKVIVSLDSDFLQGHPAAVRHMRDFARGRRADDAQKTMNRLYAFEGVLSLTGANADHRYAVRSAHIGAVAGALATRLVGAASASAVDFEHHLPVDRSVLDAVQSDLAAHRGESIIIAGPRQPAEVHYLAHLLNDALGNIGQTVTYTVLPGGEPHGESLKSLGNAAAAGQIETLLILGGNPVFDAPADLDFTAKLAKVGASVHLSLYEDETSAACTWHLPMSHYLEAWGDARAWDGTVSLVQPLIEPLFGGRSAIDVLAMVAEHPQPAGYDLVRETMRSAWSAPDFEKAWRKALHDGVVADSAAPRETPNVRMAELGDALAVLAAAAAVDDGFELVFTPDPFFLDGRFANNGWLMEAPDPVTKLTWDNAVVMNAITGESLGLKTGSRVRITIGNRNVDAPVLLLPGQHAKVLTLPLGWGRGLEGRICLGAGTNVYPLRTSAGLGFISGAGVQGLGGSIELAITQDHHAVNSVAGQGTQERLPTLFREATLEEYREHPDFAKHRTHVVHRLSLWDEPEYDGPYRWGMSIDLSACTGCSACVIACQAENNIPIVGKDQVLRGREMHWIRVDRYFAFGRSGDHYDAGRLENVAMAPITCMHCETAPCEQVCPVAATTHDQDGLNVMVYNRCVGTRYCSNNCPYKVRRFNYFDFHRRGPVREAGLFHVDQGYYTRPQAAADPLQQMQFNPEVTVRVRGVMEKCTYCIQRIAAAKIEAKNDWVRRGGAAAGEADRVPIPDGAIVPACAQACPAEAIVFGDLRDSASRVSALHRRDRAYEMLEEINTKPRTKYLARLRNPSAALAGAGPASGGGHAAAESAAGSGARA